MRCDAGNAERRTFRLTIARGLARRTAPAIIQALSKTLSNWLQTIANQSKSLPTLTNASACQTVF